MTELLRRRALVEKQPRPHSPAQMQRWPMRAKPRCEPCSHKYLPDKQAAGAEPTAWPTGVGWYDAGAA